MNKFLKSLAFLFLSTSFLLLVGCGKKEVSKSSSIPDGDEMAANVGGCVASVLWRMSNGAPVSDELKSVASKYSDSVTAISNEVKEKCADPQGMIQQSCFESKLPRNKAIVYGQFRTTLRLLDGPQDPNAAPNYETTSIAFCGPLMK